MPHGFWLPSWIYSSTRLINELRLDIDSFDNHDHNDGPRAPPTASCIMLGSVITP